MTSRSGELTQSLLARWTSTWCAVLRAAQRPIEHAFVWSNQPMTSLRHSKYIIRDAQPNEFLLLGELTVNAYASLPGMPAVAEQADYYEVLRNVAKRAHPPATRVLTAVSDNGQLLGTVDFFADMSRYGSGAAASSMSNAAGIRYLAVKPESRGSGIGRFLTAYCVDVARALGKSTVLLHTTKAMPTAWAPILSEGRVRIDYTDGGHGQTVVLIHVSLCSVVIRARDVPGGTNSEAEDERPQAPKQSVRAQKSTHYASTGRVSPPLCQGAQSRPRVVHDRE